MGAEEAYIFLGGHGLFQTATYVIINVLYSIPSMWQYLAIVFEGYTYHRYHCKLNANQSNSSLVPTADCSFYESCELYKYNSSYRADERIHGCKNGYTFYDDYYLPDKGSTIAMEFNLWCNMILVEASQMCFTGGIVFGSIALGPFSDMFGRKKVFFGAQFIMCLFGIAMAFSTDIIQYSSFQFLTGCFTMANDLAGYVLGNELFPADIRSYMAPAMHFFTALGQMSLVIFGYYFRHWRMFQLAVSLIPLVTMMYWWHCPESVRWLLANDRYDEAKKILDECSACNEIPPVPEDVIKMEPEDVAHGSKHMSLFTYLRQRKTLVYFLVVCYQIFATQIVLYGLTLMAQALPGDFFLSFFILTCLDFPGTLMAMFILFYIGRRIPMCLLNLTATFFLSLAALFSARPDLVTVGDPQVLVTIFSCIAKFVGAASWCVVLVYAQEIFPTNIRSSGVGAVAGVGFLGLFIAPLAVTLSRVDAYIPTAAFAGLMFVAIFTALLGPETRGRVLPTTVEEVLSWGYSLTEEDKKKARLYKQKMDDAKKKILAYRSGKSSKEEFRKPYTVGGAVNPAYDALEYVNGRDEKTAL